MTKKSDGELVAEAINRLAAAVEVIGQIMIGDEEEPDITPITYIDGTPIN